jgi:RHS repeat-associated protein
VTCLLTPYQQLAAKYLYDPYGNLLAMSGSLAAANVYRFSSKEWDGNSGLYYYLYRFYDPNLQRWLNRDPIAEQGWVLCGQRRYGKYSKLLLRKVAPNLYEFVKNDPITRIDPYGDEILDYGPGATCRSPLDPPPSPCPPGQTPTPYWQLMGYDSASSCATAEWQLNRDTWGGILGGIGGGILGSPGGGLGIGVGGGVGTGIGGTFIPNIICGMIYCL